MTSQKELSFKNIKVNKTMQAYLNKHANIQDVVDVILAPVTPQEDRDLAFAYFAISALSDGRGKKEAEQLVEGRDGVRANPNCQDSEGNTLLHWLIKSNADGAEEKIDWLKGLGVDPNIRNNNVLSSIDLAKCAGQYQLAEQLKGATATTIARF